MLIVRTATQLLAFLLTNLLDDILATYSSNSTNATGRLPSPVTQIDGQDAEDYLEALKQVGILQDPDALYNNLFWQAAQVAIGSAGTGFGVFSGGGRGRFIYPGPTTSLTFANGTTSTYANFARVLLPLTGVTDGESFYQTFCTGSMPSASAGSPTTSMAATSTAVSTAAASSTAPAVATYTSTPSYPVPVVRHPENWIAGYYLNFSGYESVAVLSVPSFVGDILLDTEQEFQATAQTFLAESKAAGKTKLIVDLSANAGGTILQGYDLFKQLFPTMTPFGETRFRAHEAFDIIGEQFSELAAAYPTNQSDTEIEIAGDNPFNYREDLTVALRQYGSWPAVYGPHEFYGDNFTSLIRYNLSDPLQTVNPISGVGIVVTGYLNRTNFTQPYAAEDIILVRLYEFLSMMRQLCVLTSFQVYDGYCASTCTIFSEFMRTQAGIKSIAMGGRPQPGEIQGIGGTKG